MDRGKHKLKLYAGPCQPERKRGARNASPGKEKPLRAGEHTVDNTRAFPQAQLSSDPLLSASLQKVRGNCEEVPALKPFQQPVQLSLLILLGGELCPSQMDGSCGCLGCVNSSGFVNVNGSRATFPWKGNCFCSRKKHMHAHAPKE